MATPMREVWAECPFAITIADSNRMKRQRPEDNENAVDCKTKRQKSPFEPRRKFETHAAMDVCYQVNPSRKWDEMKRYDGFVQNGVKYSNQSFVYVANEVSITRQDDMNDNDAVKPRATNRAWVAYIVEIRAVDTDHRYARVCWMYWPEELPQGTRYGNTSLQGRQHYHGAHELIASNHMDIVNVASIFSKAVVEQWDEEDDDEIQQALYWRQAYNVRTRELTMLRTVCRCHSPENPDKKLLGCSAEKCMGWMHEQCIMDEALGATYNRLGAGKPHLPRESANKDKDEGRVVSAQRSIGYSLPERLSGSRAAGDRVNFDALNTKNTEVVFRKGRLGQESREPRKKAPKDSSKDPKPWAGLFEVSLNAEREGPPRMEFKDLRRYIADGEKTWTEPVTCLLCGTIVG